MCRFVLACHVHTANTNPAMQLTKQRERLHDPITITGLRPP